VRQPGLAAGLTLAGIVAGGLLAYPHFAGKSVTSELASDVSQRALCAAAVVAVGALAVGAGFRRLSLAARVAAAILLAIAAPAALLYWSFIPSPTPPDLTRIDFLIHQLGPALLAVVVMWGLTEPFAIRSPGVAAPMVATLVAVGSGSVLLTMSAQTPALLSFTVAAAAGGAAVAAIMAALLQRRIAMSPLLWGGPVLMWFTLLVAFATADCLDSDSIPMRSLAMLVLAPALGWVVEIGPMRRWRPWKRELLRAVLVAAPVLAVAIPALLQAQRDMNAA
jgi:hypothetical protein